MSGETSDLGDLILAESVLVGGAFPPDLPEPEPTPPSGTGLLTKSRRRVGLPSVTWSIDGAVVTVMDWTANAVADGGFDSMTGYVPEKVVWANPSRILQEAPITGHVSGEQVVYHGHLIGDPQIEGGRARIQATGYKDRATGQSGRLLYQSRDYGLWQDGADAPMEFGVSDEIEMEVRTASLKWKLTKDVVYADTDFHPLAAWYSGALVSRVAADLERSADINNGSIRIQRFTGPSGARTTVADISQDTGGPASFDESVDEPEDGLTIGFRFDGGGHTPSANRFGRVVNLRVNGIATGDEMLTAEIAADIGRRLNYDVSRVTPISGMNALPFDLNDGTWADAGLSYLAMLDDGRWLVMEDNGAGPVLDYGRWDSRIWRVQRGQNAVPNLTPLPIYSQVVVRYSDASGKDQQVIEEAADSPLEARGYERIWYEDLSDVQPDSELASAVAANLIGRLSQPRYSGSIDIVGAQLMSGLGNAYSVRPGDTVDIADWAPGKNLQQRIVEVEYRADGVRLGVETPVSAAGVIALHSLEDLRRRRGKKK